MWYINTGILCSCKGRKNYICSEIGVIRIIVKQNRTDSKIPISPHMQELNLYIYIYIMFTYINLYIYKLCLHI